MRTIEANLPAAVDGEKLAEFDESDPRSLVNLLPHFVKELVAKLPTELYEKTEAELRSMIFGEDEKEDETSSRLRVAFWDEYDRVQRYEEDQMDMRRVTDRICTPVYLNKRFLSDPLKLAWLLHPPVGYDLNLKEIHLLSLRAMRAAMELPTTDGKGKPNVKLIEAQMKIFQHVDMRIKGAVIQRIDQRNLNVNMNADASPEVAKEVNRISSMTMEEIEDRIKFLEGKSKSLEAPGNVSVQLMPDTIKASEEPG